MFAALGPTACGSCDDKPAGGTPDAGSATLTTDAAPTASASAGLGRRGMARGTPGPVGMLAHSARSLELKDEQKAKLDAAEKSLKGDDASPRDEMKTFHTDLAAGVKAGKLDQAKIDANLAALEKAAKDRHDIEAAALNDIYAALEPAQRTEVTRKVRERTEAREKRETERRAKMAERDKGDGGADGGGRGDRSEFSAQKRVERLTRDLDLDAEQQKKAQALAKDDPKAETPDAARAEAKKRGEALLAAFEKDGFDAKKLEALDTKRARQGAEHEAKLVGGLLPILKPEQREKLAARIEKQAQGGPGGFAGRGGPGGPGGPHGGMAGMAGRGGGEGPDGRGGHRRTLGRHPAMGPDYDWFDDDEEEEMAAGGGGGAGGAAPTASAAPATSASAPAK
jgi:Spy/CpxP family protein refolding chaperone